jgi:iron(III) transport system permease protein
VALLFAAPLGYLLVRTITEGGYVANTLGELTVGPLVASLALATGVSVGAAVIGTACAWLVVRTDLPGRRLWRLVLPLPLVIPSFIGAFALIAAFAPGGMVTSLLERVGVTRLPDVRGLGGAIVVLTLLTYPYVYLPVAARLGQLSPSLEEAARLLGRSPVQVFREVVLPQLRPAILAGTLLVFLYVVSDFGAVQLLRVETFATRIYLAYTRLDVAAGLALSLNLGVLALLIVAMERAAGRRRYGLEASTERAVRPLSVPLGRWLPVGLATVVGTVTFAFVAPLGVLTFWAVRGLTAGTARASTIAADPSSLLVPALNTARVSVVAAVVAVAAVLPIAYLAVRHRSRTGDAANAVVVGGFALPGIALALALAFWTLRTPGLRGLYQTETLLVFAYVVHFGAQTLRAAEVAVTSVPRRLDDAARALGAGRLRRLATVDLPLMLPGLLAGAGLVLLSVMKELPATLLLAPPGFQTLATRVWTATTDSFIADASIGALVLVALSGVLTWVLVIRRSDAL